MNKRIINRTQRKISQISNLFYNDIFKNTYITHNNIDWHLGNISIPDDFEARNFDPKLKIKLNMDAFENLKNHSNSQCSLFILKNNKNTKRFDIFRRFDSDLSEFLDEKIIDLDATFNFYLNVSYHVLVASKDAIDRFNLNFQLAANIFAEKSFNLSTKSLSGSIKFRWVDSDSFVNEGLSEKTFFYVKWNISDFNKELESDDVEFWLNKEYEEKFNFLTSNLNNEAFNKYLISEINSQVLYDYIFPVLVSDGFLNNYKKNNTIYNQIWTRVLSKYFSYESIEVVLDDKINRSAKLRAYCRQFCETDTQFNLIKL